MSADKAQAWSYAEDFISESPALIAAREAAINIGVAHVSTGVGSTLRLLAAASGARAVLEIGTGAGVSGLWLLDGMPADGVLTTIDEEPEFHKLARRAFAEAGVSSQRTRLINGMALNVLPRMAAGGYDMVIMDADVMETPQYLEHAIRVLRPGGIVAFVHAMWGDQVADPARRDPETVVCRETIKFMANSEDLVSALLPVGDGVAVSVKRH